MVNVEKAVVARLKSHGNDFEILVDCDNAIRFREGQDVAMDDILATEKIFSDAKKGLLASEQKMQEVFNTTDTNEVVKTILKKGEVQITSEHRAKLKDQKVKKIINMIQINGVDPRTKLPHPMQRIELAFEEAKIRIDDNKSAEEQLEKIIKDLRPILPISFEKKEIAIKIPPLHAGKGHSAVQGFGKIMREDWQTDGSYICVIEIAAGLQNELIDKVNKMTRGEVEVKILNEKGEQ